MVNIEEIKANAKSISEKGLDKKVLAEATKIFENAKEKANLVSRGDTHIKPETIAHYMQLFGGNLKGLKTLDLGCGMYRYSPVLPFAFKELGADVYAADIARNGEGLIKQGINYMKIDLNSLLLYMMQDYFKKNHRDFFEGNDIIVARSFLDGGFYQDDDKISMKGRTEEEFGRFKGFFDFAKNSNQKPFVAELDVPGELIDKKEIQGNENITNFLEESFRGKLICGFRGYESIPERSIYGKSFFLFE
jgi:hypothetical protein